MDTLYKLTTQDFKTRVGFHNETLWGDNVTHRGTGKGPLCSEGYIHAYTHPLLAVLLNPIHADIQDPILWECTGDIAQDELGLKVGCIALTTQKRISLPDVSIYQRVRFGVLCALHVYRNFDFVQWAEAWLGGEMRSEEAAHAAYTAVRAAYTAAYATYTVAGAAQEAACAAQEAAYAAYTAAYATYTVAGAAQEAYPAAREAAQAVACAAREAAYAVQAAAYAAREANRALLPEFNLVRLAQEAHAGEESP